jgi:glycosyltransferase involved in cell wall biosynthesis
MKKQKIKVLLIPDHVQWVTGTMAQGICRHNQWIDGIVCSGAALSHHLDGGGKLPFEPDIIHFLTEWEGRRLQDRFLGHYPVVNTIHHVENWDFVRPLLKAEVIQVVSEQWRNYLLKHGVESEKILTLRNGIDIVKFSPGSAKEKRATRISYGIPEGSYVVGFTGKVSSDTSQRKGMDVFEAGIKQLSRHVPNLTVLIAGLGWAKLKSVLTRTGISCVWVPYMLNHEELVKFYWCVDAYWVTSRIEGGPVPLLEAMACETLCVSTPVGVVPEIIKHGENGLMVDFENADGFVEATLRAGQFPDRTAKMAEQARLTIIKECRDGITAAAAEPLYQAAISRFRSGNVRRIENQDHLISRPRIVKKLEATGDILWAAELLRMGAKTKSLQLVAKTLGQTPLSLLLWQLALKLQLIYYLKSALRPFKRGYRELMKIRWGRHKGK